MNTHGSAGCLRAPRRVVLWHMARAVLGAILLALPLAAQVRITQPDAGRIVVQINAQPFTTLYCGPETNKPYLHPLRAASGKIVTRGYPMENLPGEQHDHPHHRGLWFSHGDVNGFDFWANESRGGKSGRIVLVKVNRVSSGKKSGTIDANFAWRDPSGKELLTEARRMTFYAQPDTRTIDFDITLTSRERIVFGDTKEGTFAIRLAPGLIHMADAEGREGEKQIWGRRAEWVDYTGVVAGEPLGVAIFDHPSNPRHPTWWHARGYGLFAANIFGLHDFEHDRSKNGSLTLPPGEKLRFRYRVVIHPGDAPGAKLAQMYQGYARGR